MKCNLAAFVSFSQLHFINSLETALLPINRTMKASLAKILNSICLAEKFMKVLAPGTFFNFWAAPTRCPGFCLGLALVMARKHAANPP